VSERQRAALRLALILALAANARAAEECRVPDLPVIPDGATAADGEMLQARANVAAFVAASDVYLRCLGEQIDSAGADAPIAAMERRHDAGIERMNDVAVRFNAQLEIWKARSD
jgi:hypothetical protein